MPHKAKELQSNPLRAQRTYKERIGRNDRFTHSWAWGMVRDLSKRHRVVSLSVDGEKVTIRSYD